MNAQIVDQDLAVEVYPGGAVVFQGPVETCLEELEALVAKLKKALDQ